MGFEVIDEVSVDRRHGRVFEHGWQSWSPTTSYPAAARSYRPVEPAMDLMCYRPHKPAPAHGFQSEGLLVVDPGHGGQVRRYAAADTTTSVPSIRASYLDGRLVVTADGPTTKSRHGSTPEALITWADAFAAACGVPWLRPAPTVWCSWYQYFTGVTEADVIENVEAIAKLDLPVDVVQIDDGWEAEIGDWLTPSGRFGSLPGIVGRIRDTGRRAGIWLAPFLVGARSEVARDHPDWLVGALTGGAPADAGHSWDQDLYALDLTHPGAMDYLSVVLGKLWAAGSAGYRRSRRTVTRCGRSGRRSARRRTSPAAERRSCPASGWWTPCASRRTSTPGTTRPTGTPPGRHSSARPCRPWAGHSSTAGSGSTTRTA